MELTITATVIADSIATGCPRLTTLQLRYPRFIHAESKSHRTLSFCDDEIEILSDVSLMSDQRLSRNASSSRAIPVERLIQDVLDDPAMPIYWGANKPGMQAGEELESGEHIWKSAMFQAVDHAQWLAHKGYHKQIVNRILEPYAHINVLVTATEDAYSHFFALRDHPDAQPEIAALARAMREAMFVSDPRWLAANEWHTPYINGGWSPQGHDDFKAMSAAHCASVSYKTVDGKPMTVDKALAIYDKLAGSDPIHASPFEHIARPDPSGGKGCRNFTNWHQWRADIEASN